VKEKFLGTAPAAAAPSKGRPVTRYRANRNTPGVGEYLKGGDSKIAGLASPKAALEVWQISL